jgi:predicted nucleotidyltransferase/biotin operon repressor
MSEPVTALTPVFRSATQMRLLVEIFCGRDAPTGAELARRLGVPQQTVAREIARLENFGLIITTPIGNAKSIQPNRALPYASALQQLLVYAGGIVPMLERKFREIPAAIEVFIFGSWAARQRGSSGPPPNDVDVAIVSTSLTRFDLADVRLEIESAAGLAVNFFVFEPNNERLNELRSGSVPVFERVTS